MYEYFEGKLADVQPTHAVIDCGGVGFKLNISLYTRSQMASSGTVKLFAWQQVRDDAHVLYGFTSTQERDLFLKLISVSGIGPNTARTMLSSHTPTEIIHAIANGVKSVITSIKGIGPKTADRVLVELQADMQKLGAGISGDSSAKSSEKSALINNSKENEALLALLSLGFQKNQAEKAIAKVVAHETDVNTVEDLIRIALRNLS